MSFDPYSVKSFQNLKFVDAYGLLQNELDFITKMLYPEANLLLT